MLRNSVARIVSSVIGISYVRPVRLSVTVSESVALATSPPLEVFVSVVTLLQSRWIPGALAARSERTTSLRLYYPSRCRVSLGLGVRAVPACGGGSLPLVVAAQARTSVWPGGGPVERHERQLADRQPGVQDDRDAGQVVEFQRQRPLPAGIAEARGGALTGPKPAPG